MTETAKNTEELVLKKISDLYRIGIVCYLIPTFFVILLIMDSFTLHAIEIISFLLLLCILFPLALIGLSSVQTGRKLSVKINNVPQKTAGNYSLILGSILFIGQLFGFVFVFLKIY